LEKASDAFRTISEVAQEINAPQHVLRFWESRFTQIKPLKRGGGRRYYRPDDVDLLRGVRYLLYGEGYTIRGVQRILREEGLSFVQGVWRAGARPPPPDVEEDREDAADERVSPHAQQEPSFFGLAPHVDPPVSDRTSARREPTLVPPAATEPIRQRLAVDAEDRRKLKSALDDLVACRDLIDAALSENDQDDRKIE
jgi:DNA-binding transcriptional MerR regulator